MARPQASEFPPYFGRYIAQVDADSITEAVKKYATLLGDFYNNLPEEKAEYRYAPGKWTLKELLLHIVDAERIFSYRILRIARKDKTPLASFDEDSYAVHSEANNRSFTSIKEEFMAVRKATNLLLLSLTDEQISQEGISSNMNITVNALAFITFGHMLHHKNILEERYL